MVYFVGLCLYVTFVAFVHAEKFERKLNVTVNPGCKDSTVCNSSSVVYVTAEGPNDTLHYLWDFTHKPSVLVAVTSLTSNLNISWDQFNGENRKAINFTEEPSYSFGIVLNKIWEFNDIHDTGVLDLNNKSSSYVKVLHMELFNWTMSNFTLNNEYVELHVEASVYASEDSTVVTSGHVRIMLTAFGFRDHSEELPHLLHSANCTQVDLVLEKLKTNSNFTNSRFAVEVLIASKDLANTTSSIVSRKSLDDEHSPGVFTLVDFETPDAESGMGGYLQWRPVAYVAKERNLSNSTETNSYGVLNISNHAKHLNHTLLYAYYSSSLNSHLVQSTTVSFGLKEDGFYKKTNYTSWTFMMGYGKPPSEEFSLLVIFIISIGLGLPALLIIVSGIVVAVRRISRKKDDLFLNS